MAGPKAEYRHTYAVLDYDLRHDRAFLGLSSLAVLQRRSPNTHFLIYVSLFYDDLVPI